MKTNTINVGIRLAVYPSEISISQLSGVSETREEYRNPYNFSSRTSLILKFQIWEVDKFRRYESETPRWGI